MIAGIKRIGLINLLVLLIFLVLGAIIILRVTSTTSEVSTAIPATNNPIVEENKKPGSDGWKSDNFDSYLKDQADADRLRRATQSPSAPDAGGVAISAIQPH